MSRFHVTDKLHGGHGGEQTTLYVFDREKEKRLTRRELQTELDALDAFRRLDALGGTTALATGKGLQFPKLTPVQKRVLKALIHGWKAVPSGEGFLYINGKRACKIETVLALKDMGLVELIHENGWAWKISEAGCLVRGKL